MNEFARAIFSLPSALYELRPPNAIELAANTTTTAATTTQRMFRTTLRTSTSRLSLRPVTEHWVRL